MTESLLLMLCTGNINLAVCQHTIRAGGQQSGFVQYFDNKINEIKRESTILLNNESQIAIGAGVSIYRFSNNKTLFKNIDTPISDHTRIGVSKNGGMIEFRWEL